MRDECRLLDICRLHRHLLICNREVKRREKCRASERVKGFIEARERKAVKHRHGVESAVLTAHAPAAIHLAHHHDWRCPSRCRRPRDASVGQLLNLFRDCFSHFAVREATHRQSELARVWRVDLVKRETDRANISVALGEDVEILANDRHKRPLVWGLIGQRVDLQFAQYIAKLLIAGQLRSRRGSGGGVGGECDVRDCSDGNASGVFYSSIRGIGDRNDKLRAGRRVCRG